MEEGFFLGGGYKWVFIFVIVESGIRRFLAVE